MIKKEEIIKAIKYVFSSGTSFLIDLILFTILNVLLSNIFGNLAIIISTIIARILSSLYNYFMNSRVVFKKYNNTSLIKYYTLVIIQMFVSAVSVYIINNYITINTTLIKFIVDIIIFIINYFVQKELIFKCK